MSKKKEDKLTLVNFRDLGGLEVANGKKIKHGLIYRTAAFEPETQTDFDYIKKMNLNTVIDLRSPSEIAVMNGIWTMAMETANLPWIFSL